MTCTQHVGDGSFMFTDRCDAVILWLLKARDLKVHCGCKKDELSGVCPNYLMRIGFQKCTVLTIYFGSINVCMGKYAVQLEERITHGVPQRTKPV